MTINFDINLTKGQRQAYDLIHSDEVHTLVLRWSRQCGKSVFAEIMLIEYLCKPKTFNCYISPTFQLGRKVYKEIMTLLEGKDIVSKSNSSTMTIETVFGSTLQFFSIEAFQSIRGFTVSGILICDEAAYFPDTLPNGELPWGNVIFPLTKARNPKVLIISTPKGRRGMFWDFYNKAMRGNKGIKCLTRTIYDDELATPEQIAEIKAGLPLDAFRQEFEVEFLDDSLSFFKGYDKCFSDYAFDDGPTYIGVDFSSRGDDRTVATVVNDDGQTEQFEYDDISLQERCYKIAQLINSQSDMRSCLLEGNSIGAPMTEMVMQNVAPKYRRKCKEWTTTNSSKDGIISNLAVLIQNGEVSFKSDNSQLYKELGDFVCHYSKTGKPQYEARSGHDDRVMSLAIALEARNRVPTELSLGANVTFVKNNMTFLK